MKIILVLTLAIFLQGCAFLKKPDPTLPPDVVVNISPEALRQCAQLKEDIAIVSFEDSLVVYGDLATAYGVCAKQQATSVKLIKKLGGIQ